jgi:opacity protein-like surface antigen
MYRTMMVLVLTICCLYSSAQRKANYLVFVTAGPDLLFPNAEFSETHRMGAGATVEAGYRVSRYFSPVITSSYYNLPSRTNAFNRLNAVSVKAGGRLYLGNFYMVGEGGALIANGYTNNTKFIYTAGLGDEIKINSRVRIDIGIRYEAFNTGRANGIISTKAGLSYLFQQN